MRVAVYTICKNEAHNVEDWYQSASQADVICVADTGSTDDTVPLLKAKGDLIKLSRISIQPWRFDDARNASMSLIPANVDVCVPLDLDERLMPGWRDILEANWVPGTTTKAFYTYVFSHDPFYSFLNARIHTRHGYHYKYPDHEGLYPYGGITESQIVVPDLRIEQFQDRTKNRGGTLARLAMGVQEFPNDARMAHYYGRELMYAGKYREALVHLEHYMLIPGPEFFLERSQNAEHIAFCCRKLSGG